MGNLREIRRFYGNDKINRNELYNAILADMAGFNPVYEPTLGVDFKFSPEGEKPFYVQCKRADYVAECGSEKYRLYAKDRDQFIVLCEGTKFENRRPIRGPQCYIVTKIRCMGPYPLEELYAMFLPLPMVKAMFSEVIKLMADGNTPIREDVINIGKEFKGRFLKKEIEEKEVVNKNDEFHIWLSEMKPIWREHHKPNSIVVKLKEKWKYDDYRRNQINEFNSSVHMTPSEQLANMLLPPTDAVRAIVDALMNGPPIKPLSWGERAKLAISSNSIQAQINLISEMVGEEWNVW